MQSRAPSTFIVNSQVLLQDFQSSNTQDRTAAVETQSFITCQALKTRACSLVANYQSAINPTMCETKVGNGELQGLAVP